eukprot:5307411-Pleurochrysis_carterae.AAC.1
MRASSPASRVSSERCGLRRTCGLRDERALCTAAPILRSAPRRCPSISATSSALPSKRPCSSSTRDAPMSSEENRPSSRLSKPKRANRSSCASATARNWCATASGCDASRNCACTPAAARKAVKRRPRLRHRLAQVYLGPVRACEHLVHVRQRVHAQLA